MPGKRIKIYMGSRVAKKMENEFHPVLQLNVVCALIIDVGVADAFNILNHIPLVSPAH